MSLAYPENGILRMWAPFLGLLALVFVAVLFLWLFQPVLLPFVLGAVIAYILNPVIEKLDRFHHVSRRWAALLILGGFIGILCAGLAVLLPLVYDETVTFLQNLPDLVERLHVMTAPYLNSLREMLGMQRHEDLTSLLGENWRQAFTASGAAAETLKDAGQGLISFFTIPVFVTIIAYFMLNEWPAMSKWVTDMIPRPYLDDFKKIASDINTKLSGFIRGQLLVMLILGVGYAIALSIAGLNYGILIGILSGLLSIIPLVGSTLGLLASVLVAYLQEGNITYPAIIAAIFLVGQLIEGNLITPYVVGESAGLHPLWVFFAILAGGALFGIPGMLMAIPVAVIIGVLAHYMIKRYKNSAFYRGSQAEAPDKKKKKAKD